MASLSATGKSRRRMNAVSFTQALPKDYAQDGHNIYNSCWRPTAFSKRALMLWLWLILDILWFQPVTSQTTELNVLAIGQFSRLTSAGQQYFTGSTATLTAVFPLAIKHFNERDGRILPQFATRKCNLTLNLIEYVNDESFPSPAMRRLVANHGTKGVDVILGPVRSAVAEPIGVTASALSIPIMSHWATSPALADKQTYEYFSRTCPSDDARAVLLAEVVMRFGFGKLGMLYVNDDFGIGWRNAVVDACERRGINVTFVAYDDSTGRVLERAIDSAMLQLATAKLNVIFFVFGLQAENLYYLASAAQKHGMLSDDNMYLHTLNDLYFAESAFPSGVKLLRDFLRGSVTLVNSIDGEAGSGTVNPALNAFIRLWPTFNESDVNDKFPAPTAHISNGARFQFPPGYFANTTGEIFNVFTWSYDAVAAIGLAACNLLQQGIAPQNSSEYLRAIRATTFSGVSGNVKFIQATGDRDPKTSVYFLKNVIRTPDGALSTTTVGKFLPSSAQWDIDLSGAVFRSGTNAIPADVQRPVHNMNLLPTWAKALGYVEAAIGIFLGFFAIGWLYAYRKDVVVIQSQPVFMGMIALGVCMLAASIVPLTVEGSNQACMAFPFLFVLGMAITAMSIATKSLRVGRLWYRLRERKQDRGVYYLLLVFFGVLLHLIVLLAWNFAAPLVWTRVIISKDINNNPEQSYGACLASSDGTIAFLGVEVALLAVYITITGLLSVWVHNAPEKFQDAKFNAIAACCLAQLYLLAVPIVVIIYTLPLPRFMVISTLCFLTSLVLFGFLFLPKIMRSREERKSSGQHKGSMESPGNSNKKTTSPKLGQNHVGEDDRHKAPILLRFSPIPLGTRSSNLLQRKSAKGVGKPPSPPADEGDIRSKAKAHRSDFAVVGEPSPNVLAERPNQFPSDTVDVGAAGYILSSSANNSKAENLSGEIQSDVDREGQKYKNAAATTASVQGGTSALLEEMMEKEHTDRGNTPQTETIVSSYKPFSSGADEIQNAPRNKKSDGESSFYNSSAMNLLAAYEKQLQEQQTQNNNRVEDLTLV